MTLERENDQDEPADGLMMGTDHREAMKRYGSLSRFVVSDK